MKSIGIVTFLAVQLVAQNPVVRQGTSPSGDVDFSSARSTKPVRTGGTLPGACAANELYFLTNVGLHQCVKGKFTAVGNGGTWGTVGGAIAAQTDLWNTLQTKQSLLKGSPSQYVRGDGSLGSLAGAYEPVDAGILRSGSTYVNPSWTRFKTRGTGAVARTVDSKLSDVTSVKDYGAVGDGSTDDTAPIQAAHNAVCAAGGGDLLYPAGTYLISPVAGSNAGTFRICSNMHITIAAGATVLVKPNAGDYYSLYTTIPTVAQVDNFSMTGPGTVDQNAYYNTTATIVAGSATSPQMIVAVYKAINFRVSGLRLMISGVNTLVANGLVSGVDISNNHFTFQKRAGQAAFDNSANYIDGTNWHVTNNTFTSKIADAAVTAIEVHQGIGNIVGNTTDMYANGMNVMDTVGATVAGNTMTNAGSCVMLWSSTLQTNTSVTGNSCSINNVDRQSLDGMAIGLNYNASTTGSHSNLSIVNNIISYQRELVTRTINYGSFAGIGLQCFCPLLKNAVARNNLIVNAPVRAISIGSTASALSNITVQDNTIIDPGSNISPLANAYSAGIAYMSAGTDVIIANNNVRFTMNPFVGLNSLYIYGTSLTLTRVYAYGNLVTAVNGSPASYYDPQVIKNSPLIATVASTGSYGDLLNKPTMASTTAILKGDGLGGTAASPIADNGSTLAVSGRTLTVGSTLLGANGAISNPTGPVAIAAGGTNQDVTITPSGTGNTILSGIVNVNTPTPNAQVEITPSVAGRPAMKLHAFANDNTSNILEIYNRNGSLATVISSSGDFSNWTRMYNPYIDLFQDITLSSGRMFAFSPTCATCAADAALTRISANVVGVGNGTASNTSGTVKAASFVAGTATVSTTGYSGPPVTPPNGGVGGMINVPPHLRFLGDGADGAINCSGNLFGVKYATTFTVSVGNTCTVNASEYSLIVHATGACTIAGTLNARGIDGGNLYTSDGGGTGGGGGGGAAAGAYGSAATLNGPFVTVSGGTAGALSGGVGGIGNATPLTWQRAAYETMHGSYIGGAKGGTGGSIGGAGGNGGQAVMLMCGSINFTGAIDASGAAGAASMGNSIGAGGGGGGGYVWLLGRDSIVNSGTITVVGGAGGSCGSFTPCGVGGVGGAGWSKVAVMQ